MSRSIFPWFGGKSTHADEIVSRLPSENECYVEVFGGGAGVLWNKPDQYHEVYNDLDGDLVHFMETLRSRGDELREELEQVVYSRELHEKWSSEFYQEQVRPDDPLERAVRFYYLRYSNFAGTHKKTGFRTQKERSVATQLQKGVDSLDWFRDRIREVTIEHLDFQELIEKYDGPETLFYLDPPYYELDHYQAGGEFDHERLARVVEEVAGYVAISYERLPPWFRGDLDGWTMEAFDAAYRNPNEGEAAREATERLIMNYDPEEVPTFKGGLQAKLGGFNKQ